MPLAEDLLDHAHKLLVAQPAAEVSEITMRRAVSAAYYSVFHLLSSAVAEQVSPASPLGLRGRTQRALDHGTMAKACEQFLKPGRYSGNGIPTDIKMSEPISTNLSTIASNFRKLQQARYLADYDVLDAEQQINPNWAAACFTMAGQCRLLWALEQGTANANLFLAALLFSSSWTKQAGKK